jgi:hypothetical protein
MNLLDSIFLELYDDGFDYNIIKGSNNWMSIPIFKDSSLDRNLYPSSTSVGDDPKYRRYHNLPSKLIYVVVTKEVRRFSDSDEKKLEDFTKYLRQMGMPPRGGVGGHNFRIFYFDKWGKMTDSNLLSP